MTAIQAVDDRTVTTRHTMTKEETRLSDVDLVVLAYGGEAVDDISPTVTSEAKVDEVHRIGDSQAPRRLMDAILDGARLGHRL